MKRAVLIHGLHLQSAEWRELVWGEPQIGRFGRASRGIVEAARIDAHRIFWGTGASEIDGVREAEYTFQFALRHMEELKGCTAYPVEHLRSYVYESSRRDVISQNTAQEVRHVLRTCKLHTIEELTLISNASHLPRCFRDARAAAREIGYPIRLYATDADTAYSTEDLNDLVILEKPHRPDQALPPFNATVRRLLPFFKHPELANQLSKEFDELVAKYERKLP